MTAITIFFALLAVILQNEHIGSVAGVAFVTLALVYLLSQWSLPPDKASQADSVFNL